MNQPFKRTLKSWLLNSSTIQIRLENETVIMESQNALIKLQTATGIPEAIILAV